MLLYPATMKKSISCLLVIVLFAIIPFVAAGPVQVYKENPSQIIIAEEGNSVTTELVINNTGLPEGYELYSLAGVTLSPKGSFLLKNGTTHLEVEVFPSKSLLRQRGVYTFEYHLKGESSGIYTDTMSVTIASIDDAFEVEGTKIHPTDERVRIKVRNMLNAPLSEVEAHITSKFFTLDRTLSFDPLEELSVVIPLDQEKTGKTPPGSYLFTAEFEVNDVKTRREGTLIYLENEYISVYKETEGTIIRKTNNTKTNEGNVPVRAEIKLTKNMLTRLVTINSIEPVAVDRNGVLVQYTWVKELAPGESLSIITKTNYTIPFVLILLVIAIAIAVKYHLRTAVVVSKRVSFVKTKGGEFALKVRLHVKAKKEVSNVEVKDRIPSGTQLYEKAMTMPQHIDHAHRTLTWHLPHLNRGEERVFSYIIYSKVKMVGRFELPAVTTTFTHEGKQESVLSNRTFFMAETGSMDSQ